jgi:hypothetical protein
MCVYVKVRNSEIVPFTAYCCVLILSNFIDILEHAVPHAPKNVIFFLKYTFTDTFYATAKTSTLLSQTCAIAQFLTFDTLPVIREM